jgi:tRNA modification GTPase
VFSPDDTIVAIATPHGRGGIGVVRMSGPRAQSITAAVTTRRAPLEPRRATFTRIRSYDAQPPSTVDTVVVTAFPAPQSYTGQDVVEISAHGSPVVLQTIVRAAIDAGARLAAPGEFTLRAFLNGKLDLVQAEAVADLIDAATPLQARVAFDQLEGTLTGRIAAIDAELFDLIAKLEASLDFPDEGFHFIDPGAIAERIAHLVVLLDALLADAERGRVIREGVTVVVSGRTNVGKSSIFNALAGFDRAIVTPMAGTTRDLITERIDIEGLAVTLVDTAGAREALDVVEREGVARGEKARDVADVVILVFDGSEPLTSEDEALLERTRERCRILVLNKADRDIVVSMPGALRLSAIRGDGLDGLRAAIRGALAGPEPLRDTAIVSNMRHVALLREARDHLRRAGVAAGDERRSEEFILVDLQAARARFDEVIGRRTPDDVLQHIFEKFCIGK